MRNDAGAFCEHRPPMTIKTSESIKHTLFSYGYYWNLGGSLKVINMMYSCLVDVNAFTFRRVAVNEHMSARRFTRTRAHTQRNIVLCPTVRHVEMANWPMKQMCTNCAVCVFLFAGSTIVSQCHKSYGYLSERPVCIRSAYESSHCKRRFTVHTRYVCTPVSLKGFL